MVKYFEKLAKTLFGIKYSDLSEEEQKVVESIATGASVVENVNDVFSEKETFGQYLADRIANIAGSWPFIIGFVIVLVLWMILNSYILVAEKNAFDPYPYILLNLVLSTLAALQAPFILMSQNRQASKDRIEQQQTYSVSLKSDLEIMLLHKKLDELHQKLDSLTPRSDG